MGYAKLTGHCLQHTLSHTSGLILAQDYDLLYSFNLPHIIPISTKLKPYVFLIDAVVY